MKSYNVCYVILHYKNRNDTIECIKSLYRLLTKTDSIIVVDNGSNDDSLKCIINEFGFDNQIVYLKAFHNEGFARGNSIGFRYAKSYRNADIICMLNSDTVIEDSEFRTKLITSYSINKWDVMGFDIETLAGIHQNPLMYYPYGIKVFVDMYHHIGKLIKLYLGVRQTMNLNAHVSNGNYTEASSGEDKEWALHGAALVFSQNYINQFDGLYPYTFMYCEEYLLRYICQRFEMKMYYDPTMKIIHKEGQSTSAVHTQHRKKEIFYHKNCLYSYMVLLGIKLCSNKVIRKRLNDSKKAHCQYTVAIKGE